MPRCAHLAAEAVGFAKLALGLGIVAEDAQFSGHLVNLYEPPFSNLHAEGPDMGERDCGSATTD